MKKALFLNEKSGKYYAVDECEGSRVIRPAFLIKGNSHEQKEAKNKSKYIVTNVEMRSSTKTGVVYYQEVAEDVQER